MRFVFAIVAFFAAAVMIGLGIAQRTVFLEPDRVALQVSVDSDDAGYLVIDPEVLAAHPGKQTISVAGDGSSFLAYGRTSDVHAWIGDDVYTEIGYDAEGDELTSRLVDPAEEASAADSGTDETPATAPATDEPATDEPATDEPATDEPATDDAATDAPATDEPAAEEPASSGAEVVSPAGSDLWLDELSEDGPLTTTVDMPPGVSVLVASGSADPVPDRVAVAWPLDNATPWFGPLLTGGAIAFLIGVVLVVSGIVNHRRSRGPRRNLPKRGPGRLLRARRSTRQSTGTRALVAGAALVPALALTACSSDYWPSFDEPPSTTAPATVDPTAAPDAEDGAEAEAAAPDEEAVEPAVTVPQLERIMGNISESAAAADEARDPAAAAERFAGPALEAREANYTIRGTLPDHPAPTAIPAAPLEITLPQQSKAGIWPRTVLTIVSNGDDPTVAPSSLVLVQESPRDNFKILYAMSLVPDADPPEVAPASIGAPLVSPQSKLLVIAPDQVAAAYADVLMHGTQSQYAALFETEGDVLLQQLGPEGQNATNEALPATADAAYSTQVGDSPPIALATNDSGAMVSVSIAQTEKVTPNDGGTLGFGENQPGGALSGFTGKSAKGVQREIGIQVLFYVPAVGSDEKVRVLGWSESLIGASEVP